MKKKKSMKPSSYKELDKALLEWFCQQRGQGTPVSGPIMASKATLFFAALGLEGEFDTSSGWLTRFKHHYGIRELSIQGEKLSGDEAEAEEFRKNFHQFILSENLQKEQIYNADESGLQWKSLPSRTLVFESERHIPGHKSSKERITMLCYSNVTDFWLLGTHSGHLLFPTGWVRIAFAKLCIQHASLYGLS